MKHIAATCLLFLVFIVAAQNYSRPVALQVPAANKSFKWSAKYPALTRHQQSHGPSRSQDIAFYMDYGLLDSFYNVYGPNNNGGTWYRDDQFSYRSINGSLPVDSVSYEKWAFTWFPRIIDFVNNPNWPFNEYDPAKIQMVVDTVYATIGHTNMSNRFDTIVVSIFDLEGFATFDSSFEIGIDSGSTPLLGRTTIITDTSLLGNTGNMLGYFQVGTYPFAFPSPVTVPQGHRFIVQIDYFGPAEDNFYLFSTRRNDCSSTCGASLPYIQASFNIGIDSFNSLAGIRTSGLHPGVYPSSISFTDCNQNGFKDACEETYTQDFDIFPNVKATIPNFYVEATADQAAICPNSYVTLTANGGGSSALPYTYSWSVTSGSLSNTTGQQVTLTTLNYPVSDTIIVTLTDANSVSKMDTMIIPKGVNCGGPFSVTLGNSATVCSGNTITLNPKINPGVPPYTYSWSNTGSPLSCYNCVYPVALITQPSTYSVTVTDAVNASTSAYIYFNVSGSGSMSLSFSNTNISCANIVDTSTVSVNGSTPKYLYAWDDNTPTDSLSTHYYTQPGIYIVSVMDANACESSAADTVINAGVNISLLKQVNVTCHGSNNGQLITAGSGGTPPYHFHWNTGATTDSLNNLLPGAYYLTITDAVACSGTATYYIVAYDWNFYVYLNATDANCTNNGSVSTSIYSGFQPFKYNWSTGDSTNTITSLPSGNYSVIVEDSLGCATSGYAFVNSSCNSIISGIVYNDLNGNCIRDTNELGIPNVYVTIPGNGFYNYYGITDASGFYSIRIPHSGNFTVQYYNNYGCDSVTQCTTSINVTIANQGDSSLNNNFGLSSAPGIYDLGIYPGWTSANPGFQKKFWAYYYNSALIPFNGNAAVTFIYDSNLVYQYSIPAANFDPIYHTLTWPLDSVPVYWEWPPLTAYFYVPVTLSPSYLLQSDFTISPVANDCDPGDNHFHFLVPVKGSNDPNEKDVSPAGELTDADSVLTYTIHFQNNGTDSTNFITVIDTLSPELNPATVRTIASSSQNYQFSISGQGILKWVFNPYRLVDSITNPGGSKGFVMFTVEQRSNRQAGAIISNRASIYFDYNTPVITNTVTDTVITTSVVNIASTTMPDITVFPDPASTVLYISTTNFSAQWLTIFDVNGRKVSEQKFAAKVDISQLTAGIYFVEVKGENAVVRKKMVKLSGQ